MKYVNDLIIWAVCALAILFTIAMIANLVGLFGVLRDMYQEHDPLFWIVIAIYILLILTGVVLYWRKRMLARRASRRD